MASTFRLPSLDYSQAPASQYWAGANTSSPAGAIPPAHTLPTPPTAGDEAYKPPDQQRTSPYNMATMVQHPGITSNLEPMSIPTSFTARKPAASNLPKYFELPPPPLPQKFPPLALMNVNQPSPANISVGNLLTPPSNISGDSLSPISSGTNSVNNSNANQGLPPYTPNGFWPPPGSGLTPFASFGTGTTPQPWNQGNNNNPFPPRGLFSPSLNSMLRNSSNSPTAAEGAPSQQYDFQLPPFPSSMSVSAPANLPAFVAQQQQQQAMAYMNSQTPLSAITTQSSPVNPSDSYMQRPPQTPTYYSSSQPSSTPQQSQFPAFPAPSPAQQNPISATPPGSRISPPNNQPTIHQPSPSQPLHTFPRPFNPYQLPGMSGGPVMSNIHSPNGQMSLVGSIPPTFTSGQAVGGALLQQMYGSQQQTPHNDRPFKCDQCPQSFNRNHDLKRHKRIHLAVKPFPCGHCEKSFSRKDALKVTIIR